MIISENYKKILIGYLNYTKMKKELKGNKNKLNRSI